MSQPLNCFIISDDVYKAFQRMKKQKQYSEEDQTGLFRTDIKNTQIQKYLKQRRNNSNGRKLFFDAKKIFATSWKAMLIVLVVYIICTFRIWEGHYYHNPYDPPYGFLSGGRRLKLSTMGQTNVKKLKQTSYFTSGVKDTELQIRRFLRDSNYNETMFLDERKLFEITSKFFLKTYDVHNLKFQRYLRRNIKYFFRNKDKILQSIKQKHSIFQLNYIL